MHDIFLSHNSADKPAVEALALELRAAGIEPWLDKWNLIPGNPWQDEIEQALDECKACAVFIGPSGMGPWQNAEMRAAIDRRVSAGDMRVIPVLLPGAKREKRSSLPTFLIATTWVEFRDTLEDEDAFHRLLAGIRGIAPGAVGSEGIATTECPYRGLQVFDVEHAPLFFGRRALTEWLLEAIRPEGGKSNRFLAMLGASGSGKSSLARAGLLAQLKQGKLPDSQNWPQIIIKPGVKPLESLAIAACNDPLLGEGQHPAALIKSFQQHNSQLHWLCRQALHGQSGSRRIVVLVDQFEEVFTLCHDEAERKAFINNLLTAAADVTGQAIVLLTLRADFYGKCAAYPQLAAALSDDQFLISPMAEAELREAIEMPALRSGCELEAGLVDVLLKDVKDQPGSLPLLEYTLTRLWEQRQSRVLRLADYQALGGLEGALNKRADEIYAGLSKEQRQICQRIFLRLVQPGEGTEDTRRRANLDEFGDDVETEQVVQKLADVRLISTKNEAGDTQAFAEVTHEALIRNWGQLKGWIEADRESLKQRTQISEAADEWEQNDADSAWLLTGTRLQLAEEWHQHNPEQLSGQENQFLTKSREALEQQVAVERAERDKQARLLREKAALEEKQRQMAEQQVQEQKKSLLRTRWLSGAMAVLALLMCVAAWFAVDSADQAEASAEVARSKEIEAKTTLLDANYNLAKIFEEKATPLMPNNSVLSGKRIASPTALRAAWLYTLEAASQDTPINKNPIDDLSLFGRLSLLREQDLTTQRKQTPALNLGDIQALTYSSNGQWIASTSPDNTVRLWDVATGQPIHTLKGHSEVVWTVAFSPDDKVVASGSSDDSVRLWDTSNGELLKVLQGHLGGVYSVAYSPDGRFLASGSSDNTIILWRVDDGQILTTLKGHTGSVRSLAYSPDGQLIISGAEDQTVRLWNAESGELVKTFTGHTEIIHTVAFSPQGKSIASGSNDGTIRIWGLDADEPLTVLRGENGRIFTLTYSPDGKVLTSGSDIGAVNRWDTGNWEKLPAIEGHSRTVKALAYSPQGKVVASGSYDDAIRLWDVESREVLNTLQGHSDAVKAVAYHPNGKVIASGSGDRTIRLWEAETGELRAILRGHKGSVNALDYSPNGGVLATASDDKTVRLWDADNGEFLESLRGHVEAIKALVYRPDGAVIATGSDDSTVKLWDTASGKLINTLQGHSAAIKSLSYSPDGKLLVSGSDDKTLKVWNAVNGELLRTLVGHDENIFAVAFSRHGIIASSSKDNTVKLWNADDGKLLNTLRGQNAAVSSLAFSRDGHVITSGSYDKTLRLWEVDSGNLLRIIQGHHGSVLSIAYSPDGESIASGSYDKMLMLWDIGVSEVPNTLQGHQSGLYALAYSPDGKLIASGSHDNTMRLWGVEDGKSLHTLHHKERVRSVAFSPDSKRVVSGSNDGKVRLWDAVSGELLETLEGHSAAIWSIAYSANGAFIVSGARDNTVRLWDATSGEMLHTLTGHSGLVTSVAISPDNKFIASGALDKTIKLWDVTTGEVIKTLHGHSEGIYSVAYSPDGKFIASGSYDKTVRLWEVNSAKVLHTMRGHSGYVRSVNFSPDGKVIISGSDDKTVKLWRFDSGELVKTLHGHIQTVFSVAYSPDGATIASASGDKMARLWKIKKPVHRLLYDFDPAAVTAALRFVWEIGRDELEVVRTPHSPSLFAQLGYHIAFDSKTREHRPLLDAPRSGETKLAQVVRFLEERCAYKHPERYDCTPVVN